MKNYSKITENKDILTREYADSTYAKLSGGVTYTKLIGSVNFTVTTYTDDPFFLEQDAATWSENPAVGNKALTSTTDIGLFIGNSYTMVVNIQGTSSMFSAKAEDGDTYGLQGSKVLWFKREDISAQFFIYDHCTIVGENIVVGEGCIFVADLGSDITIANINYFSGDRGVITPVTITNSAIKINSAVTMYINTDNVINGTKTNGSITLTASIIGSVDYELEIFATTTEGLFEIINAYKPVLTESTVSGWGFTKNIGTVTAVNVNGTTYTPDVNGITNLGNLGGGSGPIQFSDTVVMTEAEFSQAYLAGTLQDDKLYLIEGETGTVNFVSTADHIVYTNTTSGLMATNLQSAVDEICQRLLTTAQLNKLVALLNKLTVTNDSVTFNTIVKATTFDVQ